jgi:hypothetical protein
MTRRGFLEMGLAAAPVAYEVETVESRHQRTANYLRTVRPKQVAERTLLVLPVTADISGQWGDGFYEALRLDLANRYGMNVAAPSFSDLPWYADHPENGKLAQERYLLEDILPRLSGRVLLVGFSKSGNGAMTLLLRHPERFAAAAAWDAPLLLEAPGKYGSGPIYGTAENFAGYYIPALLEKRAAELRGRRARIAISGHGGFEGQVTGAHERMEALGIPHEYDNATRRQHHWSSGWLDGAVATLDRLTR